MRDVCESKPSSILLRRCRSAGPTVSWPGTRKPLVRQLLPLHVAVDVAAQLATDADVLSRSFHLRGMAGAQPRLPKPLNSTKGRQR